jgi:hypothetical protein
VIKDVRSFSHIQCQNGTCQPSIGGKSPSIVAKTLSFKQKGSALIYDIYDIYIQCQNGTCHPSIGGKSPSILAKQFSFKQKDSALIYGIIHLLSLFLSGRKQMFHPHRKNHNDINYLYL